MGIAKIVAWRHGAALVLVVCVGVLLGAGISQVVESAPAVRIKLKGAAPHCPWTRILAMSLDGKRFSAHRAEVLNSLRVVQTDEALDIELIAGAGRAFWIKRPGRSMPGKELLAYLLTDHEILARSGPEHVVRKGDIVLDCGAHVGVYTDRALRLGAARVIAVEPDPVLLECLRRNFRDEIASGRVVVVPKGVWSSSGTLTLHEGVQNSGHNSLVEDDGGEEIKVPVTTIDELLDEVRVPCVSYVKMDIEGAEREALRGGFNTLRKCRPRLMLDSYHRPDDMQVLPRILREAHPDYTLFCASCERYPETSDHIVPHVTFYR